MFCMSLFYFLCGSLYDDDDDDDDDDDNTNNNNNNNNEALYNVAPFHSGPFGGVHLKFSSLVMLAITDGTNSWWGNFFHVTGCMASFPEAALSIHSCANRSVWNLPAVATSRALFLPRWRCASLLMMLMPCLLKCAIFPTCVFRGLLPTGERINRVDDSFWPF